MKKLLFLLSFVIFTLFILCSCGECKHTWKDASCQAPKTCTACNLQEGTALAHQFAAANCESGEKCVTCGLVQGEPLGHKPTAPTCNTLGVCTVCGKGVGEYGEHSFTEATCTAPSYCTVCKIVVEGTGGHKMVEATCKTPAYCSICFYAESGSASHKFTNNCEEIQVCTVCGEFGEYISHVWQEADCETPITCKSCGETSGDALGHSWTGKTCLDENICSVCQKASPEPIPHKWIFTGCLTPSYCAYCSIKGETPPGHSMLGATCESPSTCTECYYTTGTALGHNWLEANCVNPKNCSRCKLTEGSPLGHDWRFFEEIEPLCNEGATIYKCFCGEERVDVIYPIRDHHLCDEKGLCTMCNRRYDPEKMKLSSISLSNNEVLNQGVFLSSETSTKIYKTITTTDLNMPIVELNGNLSLANGSSYISVPFTYSDGEQSFSCFADLRVQGASSAGYAKKNYSIKLYDEFGGKNKVKLKDGWGKQFKYCLKANWVDYSQARNVVSGQLYGDVIDSRDHEDELTNLPSGGAIDGYPIVVFSNGNFLGLYTLNIPKDKWMFDMDDSDEKNQAIVMAITWNNEVAMRSPITYYPNMNWTGTSGWELEFASNEDSLIDNNTTWVAESLDALTRFVINNDGEDFKNGIHNYADVDKCIDSMLFTFFICADDNISKNILWATYDGVHWFSSMYDMDGTWGLEWNGNLTFRDGNTHLINVLEDTTWFRYNLMWQKLYLNFYDEIVERYWELRQSVYTMEHITKRFQDFENQINPIVRAAEKAKWSVPSQNTNNIDQILEFAQIRIDKMDKILVPND